MEGGREGWREGEKGGNYIYKVYGNQLSGIMVCLLILILMAFKILFSRDALFFLLLSRRVEGLCVCVSAVFGNKVIQ